MFITEKDGKKRKAIECESKFQDKLYGKGKRIHNKMAKEGYWRCTVCGKDKMA